MKTIGNARFQSAELDDVIAQARSATDGYAAEVLRSDLLSVGLYLLPAGGTDDQTPHDEDEVYYTVRGRATLRVGADDHPSNQGRSCSCRLMPCTSSTKSLRSSSWWSSGRRPKGPVLPIVPRKPAKEEMP